MNFGLSLIKILLEGISVQVIFKNSVLQRKLFSLKMFLLSVILFDHKLDTFFNK
jgi:hypothetical protein